MATLLLLLLMCAFGHAQYTTDYKNTKHALQMYSNRIKLYSAFIKGKCKKQKKSLIHGVPDCSGNKCLDITRCKHNSKVFVYPPTNVALASKNLSTSYFQFLQRVPRYNDSMYTLNPKKACIFAVHMHPTDHLYKDLPSLAHWNNGQNHLLIDFTDVNYTVSTNRENVPVGIIGSAMLARSYTISQYYRPGFDMSVPLLNLKSLKNIESLSRNVATADFRKYFLTFKGTTYLDESIGGFRWNLQNLNQDDGTVVISMKCFEMHGWRNYPKYRKVCDDMAKKYEESNYIDLFNSTFSLVPAGRSPASYRLVEAMASATIPVFVYPERSWVKPYNCLIDWNSFSFTFTPDQISTILPTLRALSKENINVMRDRVRHVFSDHFNGTRDIVDKHLFYIARQQILSADGTSRSWTGLCSIVAYIVGTSVAVVCAGMLYRYYSVRNFF